MAQQQMPYPAYFSNNLTVLLGFMLLSAAGLLDLALVRPEL